MFKPAERKKAKLRLAICGPSGSGKTYSSILIASGLSNKIALIDTENGSGELYADIAKYDVARLSAPYSPARYVEMIKGAEKSGYEVLVIDSLSHAWCGEGGVLEMVDNATKASKSSNSHYAWRHVTPEHNRLVEAILQSSMHIIVTMRSKTAYESVVNEKGKVQPVKVGLAPVQREGMDYEFTVVLDVSLDGHVATASKDRTRIFDGKFVVPSQKTGEELLAWLNSGIDEIKNEDSQIEGPIVDHDEACKGLIQRMHSCESLALLAQVFDEGKKTLSQSPEHLKKLVETKDICKGLFEMKS